MVVVTFLAMMVSGFVLWRICGYGAEHEPTGIKHVILVIAGCTAAVAMIWMALVTIGLAISSSI